MALLSEYGGDRGNVPGVKRTHDTADGSAADPDEYGELPDFEGERPEPEEESDPLDDFRSGRGAEKTARDTFLTTAFFAVRFNADNEAVYADISQISSLTGDTATAIAQEVYESSKTSGWVGTYMYNIVDNEASGYTVIFLDTSEERSHVIEILIISLGITVVSWLIMLALVIFLSKKAIRPIAENIERQKQFVTNAGHELKTPLAIIQSNTEAMELFNGENKWSKNIKAQVARLNELTKNLLTLSRMDESADTMLIEDINFSNLVREQLQTFISSFEQKGVTVSSDIQDDVHFKGDRGQLAQLLNLLFDNARKYTNDNGSMSVSLSKKGSKLLFVSRNTCEELPAAPPDKLFDRFYRSDESHSQKTTGQGIGLSVAASIAENHGGKITAEYSAEDTAVSFILKL